MSTTTSYVARDQINYYINDYRIVLTASSIVFLQLTIPNETPRPPRVGVIKRISRFIRRIVRVGGG